MEAMGISAVFLSPWALVTVAAGSVVAFKLWYKASIGICTSRRRLDGKTALVTGANAGIGLETAKDLARRGARVLLACRDPNRGKKAMEEVLAAAGGNAEVQLLSLDLGSLASVRACAKHVRETEARLDILINNAGALNLGPGQSVDGLHKGLQVNHFGPFLFTLLLVELLKKSAPSRIIFVSSVLHLTASLKPEDLDYEEATKLGDMQIYSKSKLANVIVSNELARRLRHSGVTVNSLHPGAIVTDIYRHFPEWKKQIVLGTFHIFCKNAIEGAQTTIHLAVSEEVEGLTGRYFSDCKESKMNRLARDEALARALWTKSEQLVALEPSERLMLSLAPMTPWKGSGNPSKEELSHERKDV